MKTTKYNFLCLFVTLFLLLLVSCGDKKNKDEGPIVGKATASYSVESLTNHEFTFNGSGVKNAENPELTLQRGKTYQFKIETFGHPFLIKSKQVIGSSDVYEKGITENGTEYGTITFVVPEDAPDTLFYICKFHKMMTGKLLIVD